MASHQMERSNTTLLQAEGVWHNPGTSSNPITINHFPHSKILAERLK